MHKYISPLLKEFKNNANEEKALAMAKYMKYHFAYYGIRSPEVKAIALKFYKENGKPSVEEYQKIVKELWKLPERENQYFAQELCLKMKSNWLESDIKLFERMIINKSWWDTVDFIASNLVGNYFIKFPTRKIQIIDSFTRHDNMWLNRVAILFQLKYKKETDTDILAKSTLYHINHPDFFIRKAIGWALREYAKTNANWVANFVDTHKFSNLTKREALKHIKKKHK